MAQQRELKRLLALELNPDETWQGGVVSVAAMFGTAPPDAPDAQVVLWVSTSTGLVHARSVATPGANRLDGLLDVMLEFGLENDFSFRPARIECNDQELADELSERLHDSGTTVEFAAEMREWNTALQHMVKHFKSAGESPGSLVDAGCTERQVREFAAAAAAFYRARLWDHLDDVDLIEIEAPRPPRGLEYATVLGAASQTYGLGFYEDPEDHVALMAQETHPCDLMLGSLTFDNPKDLRVADVGLWRQWNLPLETGDAFPSMNFFSQDGARRPNPDELDFVSLVLKALADTSEDEIDSGRWTKSVECGGRRCEVKLSIPNLLDPPNRQEWIRRGLSPDRREHERSMKLVHEFIQQHAGKMSLDELNAEVNARFTGPQNDLPMPFDTPRQRAEALCQQALQSFGRRRVQLVRQALAEDATHVEANLLAAESLRAADQRIERFSRTKELAAEQLGPLMEEVGQFWGIPETRPYMRACEGLANAPARGGTNRRRDRCLPGNAAPEPERQPRRPP